MAGLILFAVYMPSGCSFTKSNETNSNSQQTSKRDFSEITDPASAVAEADRLLDSGDLENAIGAYKRAVELNPAFADAWFKLGIAYSITEKQSNLNPDDNSNPIGSGSDKLESAKAFERAVEEYKKITEAEPENHSAFYNLGRALNKLNKDEAAEKALRQAVKLNPEDSDYQTELGAILIKLAKYREALGPLKKALEIDSENVKAQQLLEDAEAGRQRIDFAGLPKSSNKNANSNTNVNSATTESSPSANAATSPAPSQAPSPRPQASPTQNPKGSEPKKNNAKP